MPFRLAAATDRLAATPGAQLGLARPTLTTPRGPIQKARWITQAASTEEATALLSMQAHADGTVTYSFGSVAEAAAIAAAHEPEAHQAPEPTPEVHLGSTHGNGAQSNGNGAHISSNGNRARAAPPTAATTTPPAAAADTEPAHAASPAVAEAAAKLDRLLTVEAPVTPSSNDAVANGVAPAAAVPGSNNGAKAAPQTTTSSNTTNNSSGRVTSGASASVSSSASDILDCVAATEAEIVQRYEVLCDAGQLDGALRLLKDIIRAGREPVFSRLKHYRFLRPAKRQRAVRSALRFVQLLPRRYVDARTYNMLLSVCAQARDVKNALRAADMLRAAGLRPDTILYTNMIKVCAEAGDADRAFSLFDEMRNAGVKMEIQVFATLIAACAEEIAKTHAADRRTQLVLLERAFGLLDIMEQSRLQPDVAVWNSLVICAGRAGQLQRAFSILEEMIARNSRPNVRTYACLVDACARARDKELALRVYNKARREGFYEELMLYSAAINACVKSDGGVDIESAMSIYMDMQKANVAPDSALYGALMMVAGRAGDLELTLGLQEEMQRDGLRPCQGTESALITVYVHHGHLDEAQAIYRRLKNAGTMPRLHAMNAMINAQGKAQKFGDTVALVRDMVDAGLQPDAFTFAAILSACNWCDEAELAIDVYRAIRLRGVRLDQVHAILLLRMCYGRLRREWAPADANGIAVSTGSRKASGALPFSGHREQERIKLLEALTPPGRTPAIRDPSLEVPWQAHAFHIYRATVAAGVKPSLRLLNLMLACLRVPWAEANDSVPDADSIPTAGNLAALTQSLHAGLHDGPAPVQRKIGLESVYHVQAISILEEAIVSGQLPSFAADDGKPIDLRDLPPAVAEVYALTVVAALQRQVEGRRNLKYKCTFIVPPFESRKVFLPSCVEFEPDFLEEEEEEEEHHHHNKKASSKASKKAAAAAAAAEAEAEAESEYPSSDTEDMLAAADEAFAAASRNAPPSGDDRTGLGVAGALRRLRLWATERSHDGIIQLEPAEMLRWSKMIQREIEGRSASALAVQKPYGRTAGLGALRQQSAQIRTSEF